MKLNLYLGILFTFYLSACNKGKTDPPVYTPTVATTGATNITSTTVTLGGTISDDGSSAVTERGVCWSVTPNPTLQSNRAYSAGSGTPFTFNITSLLPATRYYVRAYASNNSGTGFGNEISFTTSP